MEERISKEFLPVLDKLYNTEPAGGPFRKAVDPELYECYDYYLKIKHPIDLTTIKEKLINRKYEDAWRFIADINLMFDNAWLFNKRQTTVYEYTNKLHRIWLQELTPVMQRLGYCCSILHRFGPQLLFCHGTTPDRYCQIAVGARYKCYNDQYSYCLPCFSKIESESVQIQDFSSETPRGELPLQPIEKDKFVDCTNDKWQYESFVKCVNCSRRVHQVCSLYPGTDEEIEHCLQHTDLEQQQKDQCQVPEQFRYLLDQDLVNEKLINLKNRRQTCNGNLSAKKGNNSNKNQLNHEQKMFAEKNPNRKPVTNIKTESESPKKEIHQITNLINLFVNPNSNEAQVTSSSLDDELLAFARDAADKHLTNSAPTSPAPHSAGDSSINFSSSDLITTTSCDFLKRTTNSDGSGHVNTSRDRFLCNLCCSKVGNGLENRHRKWSARRIPQTRMSRYMEVKVNEFIQSSAPSAGPVTIRVLAAYRDEVDVKPQMQDYVKQCYDSNDRHPYASDYPKKFGYTNRAIFAWQEIDGVDVCVFGMHVQEYGIDCPEPNKQVIYLSYLDSVHFFRPKEYRTAVYHQILLSYFRYVKKLGFRRAFIWVCPSRKGDDYIFYRHPSEQKMPTLKRLSDWYIDLLDKGIIAGVIEHHQNIYQYANSQNWKSLLSMPYLSGDYWPGEFERLLKIKVESQKEYDEKLAQDRMVEIAENELDSELPLDLSMSTSYTSPDYYESDDSSSKNSHSYNFKNRRKRRKSSTLAGYLNRKRHRASSVYNHDTQSHKDHIVLDHSDKLRALIDPEVELSRGLERSLKRQKEGFIVAHLNECNCSSYFEKLRRDEEPMIECELMKGREPFLGTARFKNYEFSTLRRAKFSSLAMVKHLSQTFKLDPICKFCYTFDTNNGYYACADFEDFYLCSSCHLNTHHEHKMELLPSIVLPDINDDHLQCSTTFKSYISPSSSSSSTAISTSVTSKSTLSLTSTSTLKNNATIENLQNHNSRRATSSSSHQALLPISQQNLEKHRAEDEENNKRAISDRHTISRGISSSPPPSTMSNPSYESLNLEIIESLIHRARIFHDVDFEKMKNESKALITHYWYCKAKDNCPVCKFVILSCSFMSLTLTSHKPPTTNHNNNNNSGNGGNSNKSSGIMN